jgi:hypothetical protein
VRFSIRAKLMGAVVAGLLVVAGAAAALMRFVYDRAARLAAESTVRNAAASFANLEANEVDKLAVGLHALAVNPELQRTFRARDREALLRTTEPLFRELRERRGITHWYFHLPDRTVFLRVHAPALHGDVVDRPTLSRAVETGALAAGKDLGRTAFALRAVLPWRADGELLGYLELGQELDEFLAIMRSQTGDDYALFVDEPYAGAEQRPNAAAREDHPERVLVSATRSDGWPRLGRPSREISPEGETLSAGGGDRVLGVFSTRDGTGRLVGAVFVGHEASTLRRGLAEVRGRVIATVVVLAAGLAAVVGLLLDALVFDRLRRMSDLLEELPERMARGDYGLDVDPRPPRDDELGRFERLFRRAVEVIGGALREIEHGRGPRDRGR